MDTQLVPAVRAFTGAATFAHEQPVPNTALGAVAQVLDQVDYGMVLVSRDGGVIHANSAAWQSFGEEHPLDVRGGHVVACAVDDGAALARALDGAISRGRRTLLTMRGRERHRSVAVSPAELPGQLAALLMFERRAIGAQLSVQCFGNAHGLTLAESRVLALLADGCSPAEVARLHGVSLTTVRTQIASVRSKTGASSMRVLLRWIAALPPIGSILLQSRTAH